MTAVADILPFAMLGIDTDNDSAFMNQTVFDHCQVRGLEQTRSRAYKKNDQAWVEQKNGSIVRRLVGYGRLRAAERPVGHARAGRSLRLLAALHQLLPALVQPQGEDARRRSGEQEVPRSGIALRPAAGTVSGDAERQVEPARAVRKPRPGGAAARHPRGAGEACCDRIGPVDRYRRLDAGAGWVARVSRRPGDSLEGRRDPPDASAQSARGTLVANSLGPVRARLASRRGLARRRSNRNGQKADGSSGPGGTRCIRRRRAASNASAPHQDLTSGKVKGSDPRSSANRHQCRNAGVARGRAMYMNRPGRLRRPGRGLWFLKESQRSQNRGSAVNNGG